MELDILADEHYYIGIDPDVEKCGFALWHSRDGFVFVGALKFWKLIKELADCFDYGRLYDTTFEVYVEAGWLHRKSNWHGGHSSKFAGERIAKNVGANHQVGKLLVEYFNDRGMAVHKVKPSGKVKADYFKKLTGFKKRINQDARDAAMLVYGR